MTVTPLVPRSAQDTGAARWRPTRAGILNVWRYYDEVFQFHRGRLLLRGPNGSGKSKVLELLLPYLLDANLKPSRLSTFGGSERTMHWNLMGDGHIGTTRVGYLWLEFHHAGEDRWLTCGVRLQATSNTKNVGTTYFTTTQRVGHDLELTGEAGQPLTRDRLAKAIGQAGKAHETADSYRTTVRQILYRGLSEQRYDSLLASLRQLRTPKLSERLDPGLLSTLLSSALPPLDEDDIREIAEGFERLDRQREELQALDGHVEQAERLAVRQRTYAQRVLRAAAADLVSATTTMNGVTTTARQAREAQEAAAQELRQVKEQIVEHNEQAGVLEARIEALRDTEAYRAGADLARLRQDVDRARQEAETRRRAAERDDTDAQRTREDADRAREDAATRRTLAAQAEQEAARAADRAGLRSVHDECAAAPERARTLLRAAVQAREGQIDELSRAIGRHRQEVELREEAEARRDACQARLDTATGRLTEARAAHAEQVRALADALAEWARGCRLLGPIDAVALAEAVENPDECEQMISDAHGQARERIGTTEHELKARREDAASRLAEREAERDRLTRQAVLEPDPSPGRGEGRGTRPGAPLWRLVAFRDSLDPAGQAAIEAALHAAGLLDVWVLPDGGLLPGERDAFAVTLLARPATGGNLADVLMPEPGSGVPADVVRDVLAGIAYGPTALDADHPAAVGADGTWRLASMTGRWTKTEPAFIGATARERARRRRIEELTAEIDALTGELAACDTAADALAADRRALQDELRARPPRRPLAEAARELDSAENAAAQARDALQDAVDRLRGRERAVTAALRALTDLGAGHGLPTDETALDAVRSAVRNARDIGMSWIDHRDRADAAEQRAAAAEQTARDYAARAADTRQEAADAAQHAAELAERLATIDATLGAEHRHIAERVSRAQSELSACRRRMEDLHRRELELTGRISGLQAKADEVERRRDDAVAARDAAAARFRHLVSGHLPADAGLPPESAPGDGVRATLDTARAVAAALEKTPHEPKNLRDAQARLSDTFHDVRQALSGRADLELVQDEDVVVLTATMNGVRVGAAELSAALRRERDQRRGDITDSERRLFDQTLAGDTRRHLADRIRRAGELVDDMNRRLERVRTASKVAVRLVWQVDPKQSAGVRAARELLLRNPADLTESERDALYRFFRDRVEDARASDAAASWEEQLMQVLDYTAWHTFTVRLDRADGKGWQDLTRRLHGALSGGEKAIALHLPLFAAVAAHYQTDPECPRFILLDEVFVGVDTANRGQVFDLLVDLGLDLVLTSDHEWCDYRELDGIAIHQLVTGDGDDAVTTARFVWDGHRTVPADS
ncbi:TIGR02680 family protein [Thermomonospora cellulosilytica]|uniref:Uncharacterized protein (TIGR02680 family) n=1 Tax=Thermomonospora cellulosilytica TaxID=1411118 RepID=A0A7W3N010_9ACTN|nr:TIGR02680 family protein [Thermomonospora cellulosilytica]MBA9005015.1 uncharacterized protein (TIGR02680 family) [Thermomonospora cellulosilytica]